MVENRTCSFCGEAIEPGTGKMYVRKDGTVFNFCSNKCKKNNINLGRVNRRTRWTTRYAELKNKGLDREAEEKPAEEEKPKPKKPVAKPATKPAAKPAAKKPVAKKAPAEKPAAEKKEKPAEKSE